jgi:hypothetical protein
MNYKDFCDAELLKLNDQIVQENELRWKILFSEIRAAKRKERIRNLFKTDLRG